MNDQKQNRPIRRYYQYSALGFQMVAIIGGGTWFGSWLDQKYPSDKSWFTLGMVLISIAISMIYTIRKLNKINK